MAAVPGDAPSHRASPSAGAAFEALSHTASGAEYDSSGRASVSVPRSAAVPEHGYYAIRQVSSDASLQHQYELSVAKRVIREKELAIEQLQQDLLSSQIDLEKLQLDLLSSEIDLLHAQLHLPLQLPIATLATVRDSWATKVRQLCAMVLKSSQNTGSGLTAGNGASYGFDSGARDMGFTNVSEATLHLIELRVMAEYERRMDHKARM